MHKETTIEQLYKDIEIKRLELGKLFEEQGLNDFTLKKSQELDILITKAQKHRLYAGCEGVIIA